MRRYIRLRLRKICKFIAMFPKALVLAGFCDFLAILAELGVFSQFFAYFALFFTIFGLFSGNLRLCTPELGRISNGGGFFLGPKLDGDNLRNPLFLHGDAIERVGGTDRLAVVGNNNKLGIVQKSF